MRETDRELDELHRTLDRLRQALAAEAEADLVLHLAENVVLVDERGVADRLGRPEALVRLRPIPEGASVEHVAELGRSLQRVDDLAMARTQLGWLLRDGSSTSLVRETGLWALRRENVWRAVWRQRLEHGTEPVADLEAARTALERKATAHDAPTGPVEIEPTPLLQLVYASAASQPFSPRDLEELLKVSRRNNAERGITGMLLYDEGAFLQVLEGPEGAVRETFQRIERDPRHERILLLRQGRVEAPSFEDWSMGFFDSRRASLQELPGFVDFFGPDFSLEAFHREADRARELMLRFREGQWRQAVEV